MVALQYPRVLFTCSTCGPRPVAGLLAITLLHPSKTARPRAGVDELGAYRMTSGWSQCCWWGAVERRRRAADDEPAVNPKQPIMEVAVGLIPVSQPPEVPTGNPGGEDWLLWRGTPNGRWRAQEAHGRTSKALAHGYKDAKGVVPGVAICTVPRAHSSLG